MFFARFGRPDVTGILPNLLIGEYPTPDDVEWLRATHEVTAVLSLQDDADLMSKGLDLAELQHTYERHAMLFHRVPVPDGDSETFMARLDGIVTLLGGLLGAGHRAYVHCNAGYNRAPTVVIAYLHAACGWTLSGARDFIKDRRHCVPYMQVLQARYNAS